MARYKFMTMQMSGNLDGDASDAEVLNAFPVTPTDMQMNVHVFSLMYAPTNRLTIMGMAPYLKLSMRHRTGGGARFTTGTEGLGDLKIAALYNLWRHDEERSTQRLIVKIGLSLPTGSIDERDRTPMGTHHAPLSYAAWIGNLGSQPRAYLLVTGRALAGRGACIRYASTWNEQ